MEYALRVRDEAHLAEIAAITARYAYDGLFLALYGELGAGKTAFVRALGAALGDDEVKSPTFIILDEHDTLLHVDAYRLAALRATIRVLDYWEERITPLECPERPGGAAVARLDL